MNQRLLVRQDVKESKSSIIVDSEYQENPPFGEVLAAEEGSKYAKGDRICFRELSGEQIDVDGEKLLLIKEADVMAKLI